MANMRHTHKSDLPVHFGATMLLQLEPGYDSLTNELSYYFHLRTFLKRVNFDAPNCNLVNFMTSLFT